MILVALHTGMQISDGDIEQSFVQVAADLGEKEVAFHRCSNPIDLVELLSNSSKILVDVAIVPYEMAGMTGIQVAADVKPHMPLLKVVMFDAAGGHADEASSAGIDGYFVEPVKKDAFEKAIKRIIADVMAMQAVSTVLYTRMGTRRALFDDIVYCETSGHDQILHLRDGSTLSGRYSSQAIYELFKNDRRFFKAGSSYIINLDEVMEAQTTNGLVMMSGNIVLNVPSRLRKSLEDRLLNQ